MTRRPLYLLTAVSLVLCVAVCMLWVRSYWVGDELGWTRVDNVGPTHYRWYAYVGSVRGRLALCRDAEVYDRRYITPLEAAIPTGTWVRWQRTPVRKYPVPPLSSRVPSSSFHFAWHTSPATVLRELIVPYCSVALAAAALPAAQLALRMRYRAVLSG
jgi:hypothetical protein